MIPDGPFPASHQFWGPADAPRDPPGILQRRSAAAQIRNPKAEIRNKPEIRGPNKQPSQESSTPSGSAFFGIRISGFGVRISGLRALFMLEPTASAQLGARNPSVMAGLG